MPSKKSPDHLVVVAHPDDETLFFGGLLQTSHRWQVVCVTDGNADGLGAEREKQFLKACSLFKVQKAEMFKFPDVFQKRLDVTRLTQQLQSLGKFKKIFTHGILGEYGHMHHQDVSFAVHQAFGLKRSSPVAKVYSVAYNTFPDMQISLGHKEFKMKNHVLWNIYRGETKRLINLLPCHFTEGFVQVNTSEVEALYGWLREKKPITKEKIKTYKWMIEYLEEGGGRLESRPF